MGVADANTLSFSVDQPEKNEHGEFSTNAPFAVAKLLNVSPKECAAKLTQYIEKNKGGIITHTLIAGVGFINFFLTEETRKSVIEKVATNIVKLNALDKKTVIFEYTDPNPFKLFHIGHLVPNVVGESLSRIYEMAGAKVVRMCYQGDVGIHVATAIWGIEHMGVNMPDDSTSLRNKVAHLGNGYAYGTKALLVDPIVKEKILEINKHLFEGKEHLLYNIGKKWSLDYFQILYDMLGTKFDYFIFESEVAGSGKKIVEDNTPKVFEQSEGAYVYKGEKVGLHTRVFINSFGFPTYEAKELGNCAKKEELVPHHDISLVITAHEVDEYFKVIIAALSEIDKPAAEKLVHISHGMLRLPEGKMSSRSGNVVSAEDLIDEVKSRLGNRLEKSDSGDVEKLANDIAVGAIKFSILKQAIGKDMIFDIDKSISFEGDSGPYLQYTYARIVQVLKKAELLGIKGEYIIDDINENVLERKLLIFGDIMEKAYFEKAPHHIINYLLSLTHEFNSFYTRQVIANADDPNSVYYVLITQAVGNILKQGLDVLGIVAPNKM